MATVPVKTSWTLSTGRDYVDATVFGTSTKTWTVAISDFESHVLGTWAAGKSNLTPEQWAHVEDAIINLFAERYLQLKGLA